MGRYGMSPRAYDFGDDGAMRRFDQANERVKNWQDEATYRRAGNALRTGDYSGATDALYGAGMLKDGLALQDRQAGQQAAVVKARKDRETEAAKFTADAATRLRQLYDSAPAEQKAARLKAGFAQAAGRFRELGETDEEIEGLWKQLETDPETTLTMLGANAAKEAGYEIVKGGDGSYVAVDPTTGRPAYRFNPPRQVSVPEGGALYEIPGSESAGEGTPAAAPPVAAAPPPPPEPPAVRDLALAAVDEFTRAGARVTSGKRTPQHNADVGGVPNSRHLSDSARDLVPPPGMAMDDFERRVRARVPEGVKVINEGDHVHVQWSGKAAAAPAAAAPGGARLIVQRPKAAKERDAPSGYAYKGDGTLTFIKGGPADPEVQATTNAKNTRKAAADLRKEFNLRPEVKEYRDVSTSYNVIKGLFSKAPSAAGDIAGIFSYMKMLDPGSVVREGEFATAQNAAGVPDQIRNLYNKVLNGQRLNPKQRNDFLAQAESIHGTRGKRYDELVGEYRGYAKDYDIDPDQVSRVRPPAVPAAKAPPSEAVAALKRDPRLAAQFDAKYGAGSAKRYGGR